MLSQFRSLRHTIMALVTIASLIGLAPCSALAALMTYDFTIGVLNPMGQSGMITGSFTGDDTVIGGGNGNGIFEVIDTDDDGTNDVMELKELKGDWFGSSPADFSFLITDFSPSNSVQFQSNPNALTPITQLFLNLSTPLRVFFYPCVANLQVIPPEIIPPCMVESEILVKLDADGNLNRFDEITSNVVTPQAPPAAAVPEPSTAILLSLGLIGMILYAFARRLRPTAPRRVPVAATTR